ncbi:MAG: GNAT family N-acetyltransferase [Lachnospiraceae bacterium]|nr:GNAT family N-acetyltransferase [Lachnospiraceae bacterium]
MNFDRITDAPHPMYQKALELYRISFPQHEQREAFSQERILSDGEYHFDLIYDGADFVGLILYWETGDFLYIEHFCIRPEARNHGYGEAALNLMKEKKKTLILEIDPPADPVAERRKGFYERCGFVENPYPHVHPPYHPENAGHALVVMTYPGVISEEEYHNFAEHLGRRVMFEVFR